MTAGHIADQLVITGTANGTQQLIIGSQSVQVQTGTHIQQQVRLPGAPLSTRRLTLRRDGTGQSTLIIAGLQVSLPWTDAPLVLTPTRTMTVTDVSYFDGPEPLAFPPR